MCACVYACVCVSVCVCLCVCVRVGEWAVGCVPLGRSVCLGVSWCVSVCRLSNKRPTLCGKCLLNHWPTAHNRRDSFSDLHTEFNWTRINIPSISFDYSSIECVEPPPEILQRLAIFAWFDSNRVSFQLNASPTSIFDTILARAWLTRTIWNWLKIDRHRKNIMKQNKAK